MTLRRKSRRALHENVFSRGNGVVQGHLAWLVIDHSERAESKRGRRLLGRKRKGKQMIMKLCQEMNAVAHPEQVSMACRKKHQATGSHCQDLCPVLPALHPGTTVVAPHSQEPLTAWGFLFIILHVKSFGGKGGLCFGEGTAATFETKNEDSISSGTI